MIDLKELMDVGKKKGLTNRGYMELDYFQEMILLAVSRELPGLTFKGGTSLYKVHNLDRFSEDLDFTGTADEKDIERINGYITDYGYGSEVLVKRIDDNLLIKFRIQGFLYTGTDRSRSTVQMDINGREEIVLKPEMKKFFPLYSDLSSFPVKIMDLKELMAEKVRALLTRKKARDAYDLSFLIHKGIPLDRALVNKKLDYYSLELSNDLVASALNEHETYWENELKPMTHALQEYSVVRKELEELLLC